MEDSTAEMDAEVGDGGGERTFAAEPARRARERTVREMPQRDR